MLVVNIIVIKKSYCWLIYLYKYDNKWFRYNGVVFSTLWCILLLCLSTWQKAQKWFIHFKSFVSNLQLDMNGPIRNHTASSNAQCATLNKMHVRYKFKFGKCEKLLWQRICIFAPHRCALSTVKFALCQSVQFSTFWARRKVIKMWLRNCQFVHCDVNLVCQQWAPGSTLHCCTDVLLFNTNK